MVVPYIVDDEGRTISKETFSIEEPWIHDRVRRSAGRSARQDRRVRHILLQTSKGHVRLDVKHLDTVSARTMVEWVSANFTEALLLRGECLYRGVVAGHSESEAVIDLCHGLVSY